MLPGEDNTILTCASCSHCGHVMLMSPTIGAGCQLSLMSGWGLTREQSLVASDLELVGQASESSAVIEPPSCKILVKQMLELGLKWQQLAMFVN